MNPVFICINMNMTPSLLTPLILYENPETIWCVQKTEGAVQSSRRPRSPRLSRTAVEHACARGLSTLFPGRGQYWATSSRPGGLSVSPSVHTHRHVHNTTPAWQK